ncbi:MAG: FAD-binding protein [Alphaproteobacteria bacterium]|nr:FAD-binding protein [Alphaproteobacteria bacterium]
MEKAASESQVAEFVRAAREKKAPFEIVAGGTLRAVGKPLANLPLLDVSGLSGIIKYEPEELIVTAAPATPLTEIAAVLGEKNQRLGFDPADWSQVLASNGVATLGGAASADASGSGRLRHGGARDSLLAFRAVNGLGETFRGGAKVVKNVTGFDLPKLVCGAHGTLCVLTEMTFRVYPRPQLAVTLCLSDVTPDTGFAALRKIAHSALEPAGLAYLPSSMSGSMMPDVGQGAALIKLEGAAKPLEEKLAMAHGLLGNAASRIDSDPFVAIGSGDQFADLPGDIWRVMIAPSDAPRVARELNAQYWLGDWAGGLLWLAAPPSDAARIRAIAAAAKGQAMLLRASAESRVLYGLYAPQPEALAGVSRAVKAAFDPLFLFNPGRL